MWMKSHGNGGILRFVQAGEFFHSKLFESCGRSAPLSHPFFRLFSLH